MENAKTETQKPKTLMHELTTKNISNYKNSFLQPLKKLPRAKNRKKEN